MRLLTKLERYELGDGDLIGFGAYHHLYRIRFADNAFDFTTPKKKKKKVEEMRPTVVYFSESSDEEVEIGGGKENKGILKQTTKTSCIWEL